jgi:hypothetical protein
MPNLALPPPPWRPEVAAQPWAEIAETRAIIHSVRNFRYRSLTDFDPVWETRTIDFGQIEGADIFVTSWGIPLVVHAIVSFRMAAGPPLAISVEARRRVDQRYSTFKGFFRVYRTIYLPAEEADVIGVRTNFRKNEQVYLYRTRLSPADTRGLFRAYLGWMNAARQPEWYNALTNNCGSRPMRYLLEHKIGGLSRWDWRTILNGAADRMLYDHGDLVTEGLPFAELRRRARINAAAQAAPPDAEFWRAIRTGRPGFGPAAAAPS